MMTDTPRTIVIHETFGTNSKPSQYVRLEEWQKLERELAAMTKRADEMERLKEHNGEMFYLIERELVASESERMKYRERAWHAELQLKMRYGLRKEISEALGLTDETGDDALRRGLDTVKALKRELADLKAQHAWRPIDTAPKDGTEMLVYVHGDIALMSYQIHCSAWMYSDGSIEDEIDKALWQPLPEPPKEGDK